MVGNYDSCSFAKVRNDEWNNNDTFAVLEIFSREPVFDATV